MRGLKTVLIIWLVVSATALGVEQDKANPNEESRNCETHTIINNPPNSSYIITRCGQNSKRDLNYEKPIASDTKKQGKRRSNNFRYPFNTFDDLDAQVSMADSTDRIKTYTFLGLAVGTIGLVLIGWTLAATRQAANAAVRAAEISDNSEKPTILCKVAEHELPGTGRVDGPIDENSLFFDIINVGRSVGFLTDVEGSGKNVSGPDEFGILENDWKFVGENFTNIISPAKDEEKDGLGFDFALPVEQIPKNLENDRYFAWIKLTFENGYGKRWCSTCCFKSTGQRMGSVTFGLVSYTEQEIKA